MGFKRKSVLTKSTLKGTNEIQDDDVTRGKYRWKEKKKTTFLNCIFGLSPYMFTQMSSVDSY